mgnify:CR=1 FL=1
MVEATHITSNPRSGKLGTINEDDDDDLPLFKTVLLCYMVLTTPGKFLEF